MLTGTTSHKLDLISRYSSTEPFKIGVNGVNYITYNIDGTINQIFYTIGEIIYTTTFDPQKDYPTTFSIFSDNDETQSINAVKEELKMGLVFPPKINNELFIERLSLAVFERHSRLATIKNVGNLEEYRNGYYNVIKNI